MAKMLIKIYCVVASLIFGLCALVALNVGLTLAAIFAGETFMWWLAGGSYCFTAMVVVNFIGKMINVEDEDND